MEFRELRIVWVYLLLGLSSWWHDSHSARGIAWASEQLKEEEQEDINWHLVSSILMCCVLVKALNDRPKRRSHGGIR